MGLSWNLCSRDNFSSGGVKFHKLGEIELGLLEDLDLADEDVLERENLGALLGDLLSNIFGEAGKEYNY